AVKVPPTVALVGAVEVNVTVCGFFSRRSLAELLLAASRSASEASTAIPADVPRRDPSSCLIGSRTLQHDPKGELGRPPGAGSVWIKALRLRALIPRGSLRDRCLVSRTRQTLPGPAPGDPTYFDPASLIVR